MLAPSLLCAEGIVRSFEELKSSLDKDHVKYQENKASQLVIIQTTRGSYKGGQVIVWSQKARTVHFMEVIQLRLPKEKLSDVETAFSHLNHTLTIPGLGINHGSNRMYFRISVPFSPQGGLTEEEVQRYFKRALKETVDVIPTVKAVIESKVKPEDVVKHYMSSLLNRTLRVGTYTITFDGSNWEMTMNAKGDVKLSMNGNVVVESKATVKGSQITFQDSAGPLAEKSAGTYQWMSTTEGLTFKKIKDDAKGRNAVLTSGAWKRQVAKKIQKE